MAETGVGAKSSVKHYMPSKTVGSGTISTRSTATSDTILDIVPWPAGSANGVSYLQSNGGYTSGGELVKGAVVELRRDLDESRHATESFPMR
jgi:hypothetical protein